MDPCRSVWDGGDASRRYLYTPVSITQADNECRLEGDKTHEIFHFFKQKSGGGDISYVVPTKLKSGGGRVPPSPTDLRPCSTVGRGLQAWVLKYYNTNIYPQFYVGSSCQTCCHFRPWVSGRLHSFPRYGSIQCSTA